MKENSLLRFIYEHRASYIAGVLFMLAASYVQTLFPAVLGNTIDILKAKGFSARAVDTQLIYILLIAAGTFVTTYTWRNLVIGNARKLERDLRETLFNRFQQLPPAFYGKNRTGDLIAYAINDINAVRQTFGPALSMSINGVVVCALSIWSMFQAIHWQLTLLSLLPLPVIVCIMLAVGKTVKRRFTAVQETFAAISGRVNENVNGIRVIKAYVQEDEEVRKFETLNDRMVGANLRMVQASAILSPLIELSFTVSFVLILVLGGNMVLRGTISLGAFVAGTGYLTMILTPILSIGQVITAFQRGMASYGRLRKILCEPVPRERPDAVRTFSMESGIRFRHLSFCYPGTDVPALRDIGLQIPRGHTLGIVGRTGAGKSTLVSLLLRLCEVPDGAVFIGETDINQIEAGALRDRFGFVPQEQFLFGATIDENIRFFNGRYTADEVENAARLACIYDSIMELPDGFQTVLGERGVNLSGGQKQRVAIARALLRDPEVLVLDDALSAVDTVTETAILRNLRAVRRNKTTIVIASRLSAVMEADEIIVMEAGGIRERGTHAQLLREGGVYSDIYHGQFGREERADRGVS